MDNQLKDSVIQAMEIMIGPEKKITYECSVIKCLDAIAGEYELNYMSNRITAYAIDTSKKYNFNDIVVVMAPQGDFNDVKYILGLANPEEALSEEEEQDNYINISGDLLDKDNVKVDINDKGVYINDNLISEDENCIYSFEFENEKIETPKTGDDSNIGLWIKVLIISCLLLAVLVFLGLKKFKN